MVKPETKKMLAAAVAAAEAKQAVDLRILELDAAESSLTDYFLVMSGANARQIQTLADEIELRLKREFGEMPNSREGYRQAEWVLLDYVDFVVHIFSEEKRAYYGLERLKKSARGVSAEELARKLVSESAGQRVSKKAAGEKPVSEEPVGKKTGSGNAVGKKAAGKRTSSRAGTKAGAAKAVGKRAMAGSAVRAAKKPSQAARKSSAGRKPAAKKSSSSRKRS